MLGGACTTPIRPQRTVFQKNVVQLTLERNWNFLGTDFIAKIDKERKVNYKNANRSYPLSIQTGKP